MAPAPTIITQTRDSTGGGVTKAAIGVLVEGAHVLILHLAKSLPAPTDEITGLLHVLSMEDQHTQATEIFDFLVNADPNDLPWINKGNRCDVGLVNVPKTSLVKVVYVMEIGSSPIGATAPPVNRKLLLYKDMGIWTWAHPSRFA